MLNVSSICIKPVFNIERKCSSIKRIHEIIMTMPDPIITVSRYYNNIIISATNKNGICTYGYNGPCASQNDIALSLEIDLIS